MSFLSTDALFCCCNTANFPTVGLIKEHLNLNLNLTLKKLQCNISTTSMQFSAWFFYMMLGTPTCIT